MTIFIACGKLSQTNGGGIDIPLILNKSGIIKGDLSVLSEFVENGKLNFPFEIKEVKGYFNCNDLALISLKGCPKKVVGSFYCYNNKLTSLEGCPKEVGGDFYCRNNNLTSLEGAPQKVGGDFYCRNNNLTSLEGAPQKVGGDFDCSRNSKEFTEEEVRAVCDVGGKVYV
jgi:hypothetical protein